MNNEDFELLKNCIEIERKQLTKLEVKLNKNKELNENDLIILQWCIKRHQEYNSLCELKDLTNLEGLIDENIIFTTFNEENTRLNKLKKKIEEKEQ